MIFINKIIMVRSQTKIRKTLQANMLLEQRYLAKEDYDTVQPEEDFDYEEMEDTPLEDEPSLFDDEEDDDIEDFGFDVESGDDTDVEGFDSKMKFKDTMKKNKFSDFGIGDNTRWDSDSEKEYSPIKPTDLPLDKFLKSKYNK